MPPRFIDTQDDLQSLCTHLATRPHFTIDTEFLREKTYYAQLCLIQVATEDVAACIDPLALEDLSPLTDVLANTDITKIFHSSSQDLELLYQVTGTMPSPVFDTQVAASLLGQGEQVGYAKLVEQITGVQLPKDHTRTDWSRRPLDEGQIDYALNDVTYLLQVWANQHHTLVEKDRLAWLQHDFDALTDPARYEIDPNDAWKKVKGAKRLRGKALPVVKTLAAWREQQAKDRNKPKRWILDDNLILDLARFQPKAHEAMHKIRGIDAGRIKRDGDTLIRIIEEGAKLPRDEWPSFKTDYETLSPNQEAMVEFLLALLRLKAHEAEMSVGALSSRKEMEALVRGKRDLPVLKGWKLAIAGETLQHALDGKISLSIQQQQLLASEMT